MVKPVSQHLDSIFLEAVALTDESARTDYLDRTCGKDSELRSEVEKLLSADHRMGSFLDAPAYSVADGQAGTEAASDTRADSGPVEPIGVCIGPYRLIQKIGEGGMGIVYLAEQEQPIRRMVAVKTIKPGMDSRQIIHRFEAERQALALMDHPNIAKVLDAGVTQSGRPYFVMELVHGVPITRYCDQHQLTPRERLALLIPVCQAVQHAHQKGIIHRDLKPTNVLISEHEDIATPKVIDFGVAKALGQSLTEHSLTTGIGKIVGTFEYMSPEQADFHAVDIDTRADIYSLGVLLFELITGSTPITRQEVHDTPGTEILRIIREDEPPRPSTRLTESPGTLATVASQRKRDPARLTKEVRGELDWIVMKCLEKDRNRRYATANALVRDIERYLHDEPLEAGPPAASYRLRKLARKYRTPLAVAASISLLLVLAAVGGSWLAFRATRAERLAADEAAIARAVNRFLQEDLLGQADIENQPMGFPRNINITARELVDRAAQDAEHRFRGQGRTEAAIRFTLGNTYLSLGEHRKAEDHLRRALALRKKELGPSHPETLVTMSHLAHALMHHRKYGEAEELYEYVRATLERSLGADHPDTLQSTRNLANLYSNRGQNDEAESLLKQAIQGFRDRCGADHIDTFFTIERLARHYRAMARYEEAEPLLRQAMEGYQAQLGTDHPYTVRARVALGDIDAQRGDAGAAETGYREALDTFRATLGDHHPETLDVLTKLGMLYRAGGRYEEAEPLFQQALDGYRSLGGEHNDELLNAMNNLAALYRDQGRFAEAAPLFERVVANWTARRGPHDRQTLISMNNLAMLYNSCGRMTEAEPLLKQVLDGCNATLGPDDPFTLNCLSNLGGYYMDRGQFDQAEPLFRQALEARQRTLGSDHVDTIASMNHVALALNASKRFSEAEPIFEKVLDARRAKLGPDHPDTLRTINSLAILYRDTQRPDLAEQQFQSVLEMRRKKLGDQHPDTLTTLYNFALLNQGRGQRDSAIAMLREAVNSARETLGPTHPQTQRYINALAEADSNVE